MTAFAFVRPGPRDLDGETYAGVTVPRVIREYGPPTVVFLVPGRGLLTQDSVSYLWEAFDRDGESVGWYPTRLEAAEALL